MVNLKRMIDLTKEIQKNQKNENQVERNKTSQNELNYEIKNKSKIHKRTSNKLKIKRIRTKVKTLINQMITLKFCMSNVNFEGKIEKKKGVESIANDKSRRQKKRGLRGANDTVKKDFDCKETLCIHQRVHCKRQKSFFYLNNI
jgi:hypothetical protein